MSATPLRWTVDDVVAVVVIAAIVLVALIVFVIRRRRGPDPVDSFRRQIDALSPEARRPTIDRRLADDARRDDSSEVPPDDRSDGEDTDGN